VFDAVFYSVSMITLTHYFDKSNTFIEKKLRKVKKTRKNKGILGFRPHSGWISPMERPSLRWGATALPGNLWRGEVTASFSVSLLCRKERILSLADSSSGGIPIVSTASETPISTERVTPARIQSKKLKFIVLSPSITMMRLRFLVDDNS